MPGALDALPAQDRSAGERGAPARARGQAPQAAAPRLPPAHPRVADAKAPADRSRRLRLALLLAQHRNDPAPHRASTSPASVSCNGPPLQVRDEGRRSELVVEDSPRLGTLQPGAPRLASPGSRLGVTLPPRPPCRSAWSAAAGRLAEASPLRPPSAPPAERDAGSPSRSPRSEPRARSSAGHGVLVPPPPISPILPKFGASGEAERFRFRQPVAFVGPRTSFCIRLWHPCSPSMLGRWRTPIRPTSAFSPDMIPASL